MAKKKPKKPAILRPVKASFHLPIKDNPDENNHRRSLLKEINDVLKQIILRWPAWSFAPG
jgi:hypothetical protein